MQCIDVIVQVLEPDYWKLILTVLGGLGLFLLGMKNLSEGLQAIAGNRLRRMISLVTDNRMLATGVGMLVTMLVQSSSITTVMVVGFVNSGFMTLTQAVGVIMGANIGTTITGWLASFGSNTNAKRAAYFHIVFNVLGVAWITAVFPAYLMLVRYIVAGDPLADMSLASMSAAEITAGIAMAHTGFNVTNTIVFLPLAGYLAAMLRRMIPDKAIKVEEDEHLTNLDIRMLESPVVAVEQSRVEVLRMAEACKQMMVWLKELLQLEEPDEQLTQQILDTEEELDRMQGEIVTFMSNLLVGNVPHTVVQEARSQLRLADEYESISDCIASILKANRHLHRRGLRLPPGQQSELFELHDMVADYLAEVSQYYEQSSDQVDLVVEVLTQGEVITKHAKSLYKRLLAKAPKEQIDARAMVAYNRAVAAYRRIRDHLVNIAEALAGDK